MSLEAALKENTEALTTLIGLLGQDIELRKTAIEKVSESINKSGGSTTKTTKTEDKPKGDDKPKETTSGGDDKMAEAKKLIAKYVGGAEDNSDERKARNKKVVGLLSNPKVKKDDAPDQVKDLKDVKPNAMSAVIKQLNKFIDDGNVLAPKEDEDDISLED